MELRAGAPLGVSIEERLKPKARQDSTKPREVPQNENKGAMLKWTGPCRCSHQQPCFNSFVGKTIMCYRAVAFV